jgi:hypothetical protein
MQFAIKGVPAQDFPSEKQAFLKAGSVRSGYMGADPKVPALNIAYVSILQHTYVRIRQHTSAYRPERLHGR